MSREFYPTVPTDDRFPPIYTLREEARFPGVYLKNSGPDEDELPLPVRTPDILWADARTFLDFPGEERVLESIVAFGSETEPDGSVFLRCDQQAVTCSILWHKGGNTITVMIEALQASYPSLFPTPEQEKPGMYIQRTIGDFAAGFVFPNGLFDEETPFVIEEIVQLAQQSFPPAVARKHVDSLLRSLAITQPR